MVTRILLLGLLWVLPSVSQAADVAVCSNSALATALSAATAGTRILLCSGIWTNVQASISASGTASSPIIITAAVSGGVTITGTSYIELAGSNIQLSGFRWSNYGDPAPKRAYITTTSGTSNNKISEMTFEDDPGAVPSVYIYNISLRGTNHEVAYSAFLGKTTDGAQMMVLEGGDNRNHNLHHLYFRRPSTAVVSGESLQIGAQDGVEIDANDVYAHHLFFEDWANTNGEYEVISIKGSRNVLTDVVFFHCAGGLSLRTGDKNTLQRIYIDAQSQTSAQGIFVQGTLHVIEDLYVTSVADNWVGGIQLLNGHGGNAVAAQNVQVNYATFVNSMDPIVIGQTTGTNATNIMFNSVVAVQKGATAPNDRVLFIAGGTPTYSFRNSYLYGTANVSYPSGATNSNPNMTTTNDGLLVPALTNAANGRGSRMQRMPVYRYQTGPQTLWSTRR